jgi:hypothetical protein
MISDIVFLLAFSAFWIAGETPLLHFAAGFMGAYGPWAWAGYCIILFFAYPLFQRPDSRAVSRRYPVLFGRVLIVFGISFAAGVLISLWRHPDLEWSMGVWLMFLPALLGGAVSFVLGSLVQILFTRHT